MRPLSNPLAGTKPGPRAPRATVARRTPGAGLLPAIVLVLLFVSTAPAQSALPAAAHAFIKQYCLDCHNSTTAEGQIDLQHLSSQHTFENGFKSWRKVVAALEIGQMPPKDADQPSADERTQLAKLVRDELHKAAEHNAGDPGDVVLRRLTSAECSSAIQDLSGLDLDVDREFVSDAAGGEGFTNVGTVQFLDDSGLERYLQAAKKVADHAVI